MKKNNIKIYWIGFCLLMALQAFGQTNWYINQQGGSDNNNGRSTSEPFKTVEYATNSNNGFVQPGDTIFIMGEYANPSYNPNYQFSGDINDPHIWTQENTIRINNLHGTLDQYISIKAFDSNTVLKGDGANIFRGTNCSYLRIEGLELYGEVERIPLETAKALQFLYKTASEEVLYRVAPGTSDAEVANMTFPILENINRPSYTDTRGIYLSNVHHIDLIDNLVHHTPGNGFRVADGDYLKIIGNEVHNCSRKSYSGTHGLVVTNANSFDNETGYKIFILQNKVHHNYNEIYSWAPSKTFITPKIDEGKGISMQRNTLGNGWSHGRFLIANNLAYWNGYSGIHSNEGIRMDFINNTCFLNSYTGTITNANGVQSGNNIGISSSGGEDIRIWNNIAVVDASLGGFAISVRNTANLEVANNLVFGIDGILDADPDLAGIATNMIESDPLFINADDFNFQLKGNSPAIGTADPGVSPAEDFRGFPRVGQPDIGAFEYGAVSSIKNIRSKPETLLVYPNPFDEKISIKNQKINKGEIAIYNLLGQNYTPLIRMRMGEETEIDTSRLPKGIYFLISKNAAATIVK